MDRLSTISELREIMENCLKPKGLVLVDLTYRREGRRFVLRVFVDRPEGGITLEQCSAINIELGSLLDEKSILNESYLLEVSSPGLDRPLKTKEDFLRCVGRRVRFFFNQPVKEKLELEGDISRIEEERVFIDQDGEIIEVNLNQINKAKQVF